MQKFLLHQTSATLNMDLLITTSVNVVIFYVYWSSSPILWFWSWLRFGHMLLVHHPMPTGQLIWIKINVDWRIVTLLTFHMLTSTTQQVWVIECVWKIVQFIQMEHWQIWIVTMPVALILQKWKKMEQLTAHSKAQISSVMGRILFWAEYAYLNWLFLTTHFHHIQLLYQTNLKHLTWITLSAIFKMYYFY